MPLDRRISVKRVRTGRDEHGEAVEKVLLDTSVWADVVDPDLETIAQEGRGTSAVIRRNYRVRWRSDLAQAIPSEITVKDGTVAPDGVTADGTVDVVFTCLNVREDTGRMGDTRRRWLILEVQKTL